MVLQTLCLVTNKVDEGVRVNDRDMVGESCRGPKLRSELSEPFWKNGALVGFVGDPD